jgi:hypothetical protein
MGGWELPCWPLHVRASTYSIVDETARAGAPKFWTTNHMSWPHWGMMMDETGSFIESINGSIDRLRWPTNRLPRANHRQHLALTTTRGEAVSASASVRKRTHTWSYAQWSAKLGSCDYRMPEGTVSNESPLPDRHEAIMQQPEWVQLHDGRSSTLTRRCNRTRRRPEIPCWIAYRSTLPSVPLSGPALGARVSTGWRALLAWRALPLRGVHETDQVRVQC